MTRPATGIGARLPDRRGAILLEVLIAVGLLGVVIACLLTAFQGARRVETELRAGLGSLSDVQRLVETLRGDLLRAEALAIGGEGNTRLLLFPERAATDAYLEYAPEPEVAQLRRTRVAGKEIETGRLLSGRRVEFAIVAPGAEAPAAL